MADDDQHHLSADDAGDIASVAAEVDIEPALAEARSLLATTDPPSHHRLVSSLARADHSSVLQELAYRSDLPYHSPTCVVADPAPVGRDDVHLYARAAYKDFDEVLLAAFTSRESRHLLNHLHHHLHYEGRNIALVTNHGQIIDIALVLGAFVLAMSAPDAPFGVLGETMGLAEVADRSNALVSRMVTTRQAFGMPAVEVLQNLCRVYLSIPQTATRRRSRLSPEVVRANNTVMRNALQERLAGGGQLLAMAASGSQDISLAANLAHRVRTTWRQRRGEDPGPEQSLHLQPLYRGTISLMLEAHDVLPVAICLDAARPACELGQITRVDDTDDCHRVMEWIAGAHQAATGVATVYHRHEDPLLTQVREVLLG